MGARAGGSRITFRLLRGLSEPATPPHSTPAGGERSAFSTHQRDGRRLYNSPAYQKVLGYSPEELKATSSTEQIHPDDRPRVLQAAEKARLTGQGERVEYRARHKDGSWRYLESTACAIRNAKGQAEKLVIVNRDITERKRAEEMLAHNAFHDGLTNLP